MRLKSLYLLGSIALIAATLHGQTYWSTTPPTCTGVNGVGGPFTITTPTGGTGYVCFVTGTFLWYAAGGAWSTSIRVAAPESGAINVDYQFLNKSGNLLALDSITNGGPSANSSGYEVQQALSANQPWEVDLLGAQHDGPNYGFLEDGSVYVQVECPDATTCSYVNPQLVYSALPAKPYSLSVPISWANTEQLRWSAEGIDDGDLHTMSFAIYNAGTGTTATTYTVTVYDSTGTVVGTGATPPISPLQQNGTGSALYGTGAVWAGTLRDLLPSMPSGLFKIVISGTSLCYVEVLQFTETSATTLQVAQDAAPGATASAVPVRPPAAMRSPTASGLIGVLAAPRQ